MDSSTPSKRKDQSEKSVTEKIFEAYDTVLDEHYDDAIKQLHGIITENDPSLSKHLLARIYGLLSYAYFKVNHLERAYSVIDSAILLEPEKFRWQYRLAVVLFHQEKFSSALDCFEKLLKFKENDHDILKYIDECKYHLCPEYQSSSNVQAADITQARSIEVNNSRVKSEAINEGSNETIGSAVCQQQFPTNYDWYQSESYVVVSIPVKNVLPEKSSIRVENNELLKLHFETVAGTVLERCVVLLHAVDSESMKIQFYPLKVEIRLNKKAQAMWNRLEACQVVKEPIERKPKNWDKLSEEIELEEKELLEKSDGDEGVSRLFQEIYSQGSDDVKRAMVKSFQESGGTVLSTNWNEVGSARVEVKPPDGMEFKKWNE